MRLRVKPRKRKDEGSGLATIDRESMRELGVSSGEFVAIEGQDGRAVARVWPGRSEDSGGGIVRIDGQLRDAAGTRVDGTVQVEPVEVEPAERIAVALPEGLRIRGDVGSYLRDELADRAVSAGDTFPWRSGSASSPGAAAAGFPSLSSTPSPRGRSPSGTRRPSMSSTGPREPSPRPTGTGTNRCPGRRPLPRSPTRTSAAWTRSSTGSGR